MPARRGGTGPGASSTSRAPKRSTRPETAAPRVTGASGSRNRTAGYAAAAASVASASAPVSVRINPLSDAFGGSQAQLPDEVRASQFRASLVLAPTPSDSVAGSGASGCAGGSSGGGSGRFGPARAAAYAVHNALPVLDAAGVPPADEVPRGASSAGGRGPDSMTAECLHGVLGDGIAAIKATSMGGAWPKSMGGAEHCPSGKAKDSSAAVAAVTLLDTAPASSCSGSGGATGSAHGIFHRGTRRAPRCTAFMVSTVVLLALVGAGVGTWAGLRARRAAIVAAGQQLETVAFVASMRVPSPSLQHGCSTWFANERVCAGLHCAGHNAYELDGIYLNHWLRMAQHPVPYLISILHLQCVSFCFLRQCTPSPLKPQSMACRATPFLPLIAADGQHIHTRFCRRIQQLSGPANSRK